ncbi:MAG: hypothetical protein RR193_02055 [Christensenellaceae bacterium]
MPNTSQIFLMRGRIINRNGTVIHLEVAVDVTEIENANLYWKVSNNHEKE